MTLATDPPTPGRRGPDPMTAIAIICIVAGGLLWLFGGLAHADPIVIAPPARAPASIDWGAIGGIIGAIAGGIGAIFGGVSMILHAIAPRTKTTVDDKLAASIDKLHTKSDDTAVAVAAVFSALRAMRPTTPPPIPAAPSATGSGTAVMLAVLLLGAMAAPVLTGCATGKAAIAEGTVAFLECEDGHLDAAALADVKALAAAELRHLFGGAAAPDTTALKAELAPVKSDLARCGWAAAVAAFGALVPSSSPGIAVSALVAGPDPAVVRDRFAAVAWSLGWAPMHVAGG